MSHAPLTRDTVLVRRSTFLASAMGRDLMLMSTDSHAYFGLDDVGRSIWELLDSPLPVSEVCARLMARYEVDEAECMADVLPFLHGLERAGIIIRVDD